MSMTYVELLKEAENARNRAEARVILLEAQLMRQQSSKRLTAHITHN